jgi:hypothetical protein
MSVINQNKKFINENSTKRSNSKNAAEKIKRNNRKKKTKIEFIALRNSTQKFVIYPGKVVKVTDTIWNRIERQTVHFQSTPYKLVDVDVVYARKVHNTIKGDKDFKAQGWIENSCEIVKLAISVVKGILKNPNVASLMKKLPIAYNLLKANWDVILCDMLSVIMTILTLKFDVQQILKSCLDLYSTFTRYSRIKESIDYRAQGADAVLLAILIDNLPAKFKSILRTLSTLTNAKVLDDASLFSKFLSGIIEFFILLIEKIEFLGDFKKEIISFLRNIPFGEHHELIRQMKYVVAKRRVEPACLSSDSFREEIKATLVKVKSNIALTEMSGKSKFISKLIQEFTSIESYLKAYESSDRLEPSCFIFEGKPGTMKSIIMSQVLTGLGESQYLHSTKTSTDGKDFWDSYDNQVNTVFDDMGQQGISQYRQLINLVSVIKYPLDCAAQEKKDTKFFDSKRIFVTTNCFMHLNGLVRSDGISDVEALWRRGYVFHFNVERKGDKIIGRIDFKHYDLQSRSFVNKFPNFISSTQKASFFVKEDTNRLEYIKWIMNIIYEFDHHKSLQQNNLQLTPSEIEELKNYSSELYFGCKDSHPDTVASELLNEGSPGIGIKAQGGVASGMSRCKKSACRSVIKMTLGDVTGDFDPDSLAYFAWGFEFAYWERWENRLIDWILLVAFLFKEYISMIIGSIQELVERLGESITEFLEDPMRYWEINQGRILAIFASTIWLSILTLISACAATASEEYYESQGNGVFSKGKSLSEESNSTVVQTIQKATRSLSIFYSNGQSMDLKGVVSGHCVLLPAHAVENEGYMTIFKDRDHDHRLLDNVKYITKYVNRNDDVAIIMFNPSIMTPFKNVSHLIGGSSTTSNYLVNEVFTIPLGNIAASNAPKHSVVYKTNLSGILDYEYKINPEKSAFYTIEGSGMCGSTVVSLEGGIRGMHVAGKSGSIGAAILWSEKTVTDLIAVLVADKGNVLPFEISSKVIPGFSGIKLDAPINTSVGSKSSIIPSELYGIFDVERIPADLQATGKFTVKDMAKKSFVGVKSISNGELDFASKVVDNIIAQFGDATEEEVVKGTDLIAGINMKSSNGFGCLKMKEDYIDKINGKVTTLFRKEVDEYLSDLSEGVINPTRMVNVENLKSELRDIPKSSKPRCFRVSTIHSQYLTKKFTMNMVKHIITNRYENQIMVGVNPYAEWDRMYGQLKQCVGVWAGDVSAWDGCMLPQVQTMIIEEILKKYTGQNKQALSVLLYSIPYNLDNVMDDTYLTNHSMPSGNFLTAIFNSIVNRAYTAMWYYRNVESPSVGDFMNNVVDMVYGDDKLNGIKREIKGLNAITMKEFFSSIGMNLTTADKKEIVNPFESLDEVSFLKRKFVFHPKVGRVMCPLDKKTLLNTIMWYDSDKDKDVVMEGKLKSFQMEMYLHGDGESYCELVENFCEMRNVVWPQISEHYLHNLFTARVKEFDKIYGNY